MKTNSAKVFIMRNDQKMAVVAFVILVLSTSVAVVSDLSSPTNVMTPRISLGDTDN